MLKQKKSKRILCLSSWHTFDWRGSITSSHTFCSKYLVWMKTKIPSFWSRCFSNFVYFNGFIRFPFLVQRTEKKFFFLMKQEEEKERVFNFPIEITVIAMPFLNMFLKSLNTNVANSNHRSKLVIKSKPFSSFAYIQRNTRNRRIHSVLK